MVLWLYNRATAIQRSREMFDPKPVTLSTNKVTLRPLIAEDLAAFYQAGAFSEIWRWMSPNRCSSIAAAKSWLTETEDKVKKREHIAFAIIDNKTNTLLGSTRYCSISVENRNIEIGFTFITPKYQQSYVNTHAKYCLLKHAFETLSAIRVEFKTCENNNKSRQAITRLGAKFEGILRNQRILPDGSYRNTAIFSVINDEWPMVKQNLTQKMEKKMVKYDE